VKDDMECLEAAGLTRQGTVTGWLQGPTDAESRRWGCRSQTALHNKITV